MRIKKQKRAYTLAEIMVVALILTVIFAAVAPLFTRRTIKNYNSKYNIWDWANYTQYDAYASSKNPSNSNELFIGVTPNGGSDVESAFAPKSKLVIRSGEVTDQNLLQRQIQFRYGRTGTEDAGKFAGTWLVDGKNMLLGGKYQNLKETDDNVAKNNVSVGYNALTALKTTKGNIAIGYDTLSTIEGTFVSSSGTEKSGNNIAIGSKAGTKNTKKDNTFIGYMAGSNSNNGESNIAIGYKALGSGSGSGKGNTFIGAFAGDNNTTGIHNTAIGYNAMPKLTTGSYNVAIGTNALSNLTTGSFNVAIGYNACSEVTTGSSKTCIGYNSGPHANTTADYLGGRTDDVMRTYIGSKPYNYGGDAVLEIHNPNTYKATVGPYENSTFNVTTVINGNLIVRGRPFFTVGKTLHHFYDSIGEPNPQASTTLLPNPNIKGISFYGYNSAGNHDYYAKCASDSVTYSFNSKCVNLKTTTSDRRLKDINSKFTGGLAELRKIKIYNYTFKDDKNKKPHVGVIAQELQKVFPNAVFQGEDGYLRIRWHEMFYAVINGIKELDRRIVALVKRTTNVESQISKLEKENSQLKNQIEDLTNRVNKLKSQ